MTAPTTVPEEVKVSPMATIWEVEGYGQVLVNRVPMPASPEHKHYYFTLIPDRRPNDWDAHEDAQDGIAYESDDAASTAGAVALVKRLTRESDNGVS